MPARIGFDVRLQADGTYVGSNPAVGLLVVAGTLDELSERIEKAFARFAAHLQAEFGPANAAHYFRSRGFNSYPDAAVY